LAAAHVSRPVTTTQTPESAPVYTSWSESLAGLLRFTLTVTCKVKLEAVCVCVYVCVCACVCVCGGGGGQFQKEEYDI
jgi:hypothetical protein